MVTYSDPNQPRRFAKGQQDNNKRMLDIDSVYNPAYLKGKTVLITGGNRGIGLALTKEVVSKGANVIITSRSPAPLVESMGVKVIVGIDVTDNKAGDQLADALKGQKIDILINNAGYFYEPVEKLDSLNFDEEIKMIDICAIGPLRVSSGLVNAGLLSSGSKIAMITSQGGSIAWRTTQNPNGYDYGHHMSKAAANMMAALLSQELKSKGISVSILHPGFNKVYSHLSIHLFIYYNITNYYHNKTDMTKKYEAIWEIEGAVDASVGAKRVMHEIGIQSMDTTGKFINCEDGLEIPF